MKKCHPELFNEMKRTSSYIVPCWRVTRTDGTVFGFTSGDVGFELNGVYYSPTNSFSGSASVSRNNLSVDNTTVLAIMGDHVTHADLRNGKYDNAKVELFWCRPDKPEWGTLDIQGGTIGEIKVADLDYEAELRSVSQKLQQPFGRIYTTECDTDFGSAACGTPAFARVWEPNTVYTQRVGGDARLGSVIRPTVQNGYWYVASSAGTGAITSDTDWGVLDEILKSAFLRNIFVMPLLMSNMLYRQDFTGIEGLANGTITPEEIKKITGGNPITKLFSRLRTTRGQGGVVSDPVVTIHYGTSGAVEPAWPTALGATVTDGNIVWEAQYARELKATVTGTYNRARFTCSGLGWVPDRFFQYGIVEFLTGANKGLRMEVRQHRAGDMANIELLEAMPYPIERDDDFAILAGCSKTRSACKAFGNLNNFQGFPDMPTEEKALATPNYSSQGEQPSNSGGKK